MLDSSGITFSSLQSCPKCGGMVCMCDALQQTTARHIQVAEQKVQEGEEPAKRGRTGGRKPSNARTSAPREVGAEQAADLKELKQRDREVRSHEQAHVAAGGSAIASGPRYTLQKGPDGQMYAIGGEVSIDTSKVGGDPQATKDKARSVRQAALAPANPSGQDMIVAAKASQMEAEARDDLQEQEQAEKEEGTAGSPAVLGAKISSAGPEAAQFSVEEFYIGASQGSSAPSQSGGARRSRALESYTQNAIFHNASGGRNATSGLSLVI